MAATVDYDFVIVGGGFYGCCLALFLRSITPRILVLEAGPGMLQRASRVNQARIHGGFHYPRSFTTAMRARALQERFTRDFKHAVVDDFEMLYAIASRGSKVTASRFARMFGALSAPLAPAPASLRQLFDAQLVEAVFVCREHAFDWTRLRDDLCIRLDANRVDVRLGETVHAAREESDRIVVELDGGREITAGTVFNVSYAQINRLALTSGLALLPLKHELAEVALIEPPPELGRLAVTVMDGPFFSTMPYPAAGLYSLTHVRYTPHYSWRDVPRGAAAETTAAGLPKASRWRHMIQDARRYLPCLGHATYRQSLFDVKTVLIKNELNDGRPILVHPHADCPRLISILGAKIDNIYDLLAALPTIDPRLRDAHGGLLLG